MSKELSRRDLLKGSALAAVGVALTGAASKAQAEAVEEIQSTSRREGRPRLGIIGCGGKGWSGMQDAANFGDVVAIADIDVNNRSKAMLEHPRASTFVDYRELLDSMKGELDAVIISTPDHHHAIASAIAMKQGLHCYTEKPLTRTIWEARQLANIARQKKVATQMGNQSTASTNMRKVAALIKQGAFGQVKEVHLWTDRAARYWKQGMARPASAPVPKGVDWATWLGPAAERPYGPGYHSFAWRGWWDFGTGALGDMGCHIFNGPFMALDLRDPISVKAQTSGHNRDSFPEWAIVDYEFGARGGRAPLMLKWHDGGKKPDPALCPGIEYGGNGAIIVCEKGTLYSPDESNNSFRLVSGAAIPDIKVDESPGHMAEFFRAIQGGPAAVSNFPNYSGPLTETVLLGNLAIWADGTKVEWDAKNMKVKGTTEFDSLVKPTYQPGWSL